MSSSHVDVIDLNNNWSSLQRQACAREKSIITQWFGGPQALEILYDLEAMGSNLDCIKLGVCSPFFLDEQKI